MINYETVRALAGGRLKIGKDGVPCVVQCVDFVWPYVMTTFFNGHRMRLTGEYIEHLLHNQSPICGLTGDSLSDLQKKLEYECRHPDTPFFKLFQKSMFDTEFSETGRRILNVQEEDFCVYWDWLNEKAAKEFISGEYTHVRCEGEVLAGEVVKGHMVLLGEDEHDAED